MDSKKKCGLTSGQEKNEEKKAKLNWVLKATNILRLPKKKMLGNNDLNVVVESWVFHYT